MRLFVAVNFPPELKRGLWQATASLRESALPIRWTDREGLHLTLKFLGEVPAGRLAELAGGVEAAARGACAFSFAVGGFGAFPSVERPRVIWVGCEGVPPLELLHHRVEQEAERLGFAVEGRPFRPHLTLGRARRGASPAGMRGLADVIAQLSFEGECVVRSLDLMQSHLSAAGASYTVAHAAALAG